MVVLSEQFKNFICKNKKDKYRNKVNRCTVVRLREILKEHESNIDIV